MLKPIDIDRSTVRAAFDARLTGGQRGDFLLAETSARMLERLSLIRLDAVGDVLDLGCGLGQALPALAARFPQARLLGLDLSLPTLLRARADWASRARGSAGLRHWLARIGAAVSRDARPPLPEVRWVAGDAHRLALRADSVDLVWSNLVAHWFDDPLAAVAEWHRVIRPGGLLMFSAFGVDTLQELRELPGERVPVYQDLHDWGDALAAAGFADPVMDVERLTLTYEAAPAFARDVDALRASPLRDPGVFARQLTVELVFGHAWCPQPKRRDDGYAPLVFQARRPT